MAEYYLKLPKMGEGVEEATITNWLKNVGDKIEIDDSIVEIATDKVDSDIVSEVSGKLLNIKFNVNDVVKIGDIIATIETNEVINEDQFQDNLIDTEIGQSQYPSSNTKDAVTTGIMTSIQGAVNLVCKKLPSSLPILLTGGDANLIYEQSEVDWKSRIKIEEDLIFEGLLFFK